MMYSASLWFRTAYDYACSLNPDHIFILSAKYGLLSPDDIIDPYEESLMSKSKEEVQEWVRVVNEQIERCKIDYSDYTIFLCGKKYWKHFVNKFEDYSVPLQHLGIGKQIQYLKNNVRKPQ